MSTPLCLGLDIGGSNIKAGLVDAHHKVVAHRSAPTPTNSSPRSIIDAVVRMAGEICSEAGKPVAELGGLGLGFPGLVDVKAGVVRTCVNLQDWHNVPVTQMIANRMGSHTKVVIANDANAAALGEWRWYHKKHPKTEHLALVTIGTGVGGGIVLGGTIFEGGMGLAGEVGHMIVRANGRRCGCGQYGCLERYASATAIVERVVEQNERGAETSLADLINDRSRRLTAEDVFNAARAGDQLARRIVEEAAEFLAIGCVNLCRIVDLQAIVIGGGVTGAGDLLLKPLLANFKVQNWAIAEAPTPDIRLTQLGADAGYIGCATLARQKFCA